MRKNKKRLLITALTVVIGALGVGGLWFWYQMGEPLYRPGMVRRSETRRASLNPPPQPDDPNVWRMEEGIELHHFSHGSGAPIVFLHGGPGFPVRDVPAGLASLGSDYEIHFYDQRGCGRSTVPFDRFASGSFYRNMLALDEKLGIGAQVADVERIRRILGRDKLILIGHSFGGFLASMYAAEFPERVEAMVLVAPADLLLFPPKDGGLFETIRTRLPDDMQARYADFLRGYTDFSTVFTKSEKELAALNGEFATFYMHAVGPRAGAALAKLELPGNGGWMVTAIYFGFGKRHDYREALRRVAAPTLILHGENDLQPESVSHGYADLLPNARAEVVRGAGHFMLDDHANAVARTIARFLQKARTG